MAVYEAEHTPGDPGGWHLWTAMRTGRSRMCRRLAAWHAVSGVSPVIMTSCTSAATQCQWMCTSPEWARTAHEIMTAVKTISPLIAGCQG